MLSKAAWIAIGSAGVATLIWLLIQSEIERGELVNAMEQANISIADLNRIAGEEEALKLQLGEDVTARKERLEGAAALVDDETWNCLSNSWPDVLVDGVLHPDSL